MPKLENIEREEETEKEREEKKTERSVIGILRV